MVSANLVSDFFQSKHHVASHSDELTNMKLLKLLYYAQGWHLATYDEPLFDEDVEAWEHGPVVKKIYQKFKNRGESPLPLLNISRNAFTAKQWHTLSFVVGYYSKYTAGQLRKMTHNENPWKDNYKIGTLNIVIPQSEIKEFFDMKLKSKNELMMPDKLAFEDRAKLLQMVADTPSLPQKALETARKYRSAYRDVLQSK